MPILAAAPQPSTPQLGSLNQSVLCNQDVPGRASGDAEVWKPCSPFARATGTLRMEGNPGQGTIWGMCDAFFDVTFPKD